jgi:hypothetical protein
MNIVVNFIPHPNGGLASTVGFPPFTNCDEVRPEACQYPDEHAAIDAMCEALAEQGMAHFSACEWIFK